LRLKWLLNLSNRFWLQLKFEAYSKVVVVALHDGVRVDVDDEYL
jgi:hypothetical protein